MKTFKPDKSTLFLWQIRVLLVTALLSFITASVKIFVSFFAYLSLVIALLGVLIVFIYLPKYFERYTITIKENAFLIKSGVFLKHERIMPNPRLIYIERYFTPLSKCFGVCGLILHATRAATITAEMKNSDIDEIMEAIKGEL